MPDTVLKHYGDRGVVVAIVLWAVHACITHAYHINTLTYSYCIYVNKYGNECHEYYIIHCCKLNLLN